MQTTLISGVYGYAYERRQQAAAAVSRVSATGKVYTRIFSFFFHFFLASGSFRQMPAAVALLLKGLDARIAMHWESLSCHTTSWQ